MFRGTGDSDKGRFFTFYREGRWGEFLTAECGRGMGLEHNSQPLGLQKINYTSPLPPQAPEGAEVIDQ